MRPGWRRLASRLSGDEVSPRAYCGNRKISLYERGLAFRIPEPGSIDLLLAGFDEELGLQLVESARSSAR